jgi:hypothetical protein
MQITSIHKSSEQITTKLKLCVESEPKKLELVRLLEC